MALQECSLCTRGMGTAMIELRAFLRRLYSVPTALLRRSYGAPGDSTAMQVFLWCAHQKADPRRVLCACSKYTQSIHLNCILTNHIGS